MKIDRRAFATSLWAGTAGAFMPSEPAVARPGAGERPGPGAVGSAALTDEGHENPGVLSAELQRQRPQAFPQSNMVVLVDTDAGITGIGRVARRIRSATWREASSGRTRSTPR